MTNKEILDEYSNSIKRLRDECTRAGISEEQFKEMYFDSLNSINGGEQEVNNQRKSFCRKYNFLIVSSFILFSVIVILFNYRTIYSNMQEYIYPGLRMLRKISIPFISLFPALTELYQETCLIQNPFFTVVDMDCWPCSSVNNIGEIFNPQPVHKQHTAPFIYKTEQTKIDIDILKHLYTKNKRIFDKESPKILINNKFYLTPQDVFHSETLEDNLYIWKLNNFNVARILRQLIPRPKVVPKFGQSTERFIIIDSEHDAFNIPDTECNFSFILMLSGTRIIDLRPAEECKPQCKSFKMELKESYLLWYNWWYWRPVVQQSTSNDTFIAHVGSYC